MKGVGLLTLLVMILCGCQTPPTQIRVVTKADYRFPPSQYLEQQPEHILPMGATGAELITTGRKRLTSIKACNQNVISIEAWIKSVTPDKSQEQ